MRSRASREKQDEENPGTKQTLQKKNRGISTLGNHKKTWDFLG
jgi:hypothetical protein